MNVHHSQTNRGPWLVTDMQTILDHSFRDFHAKGFDYLCLRRSPDVTIKAYFFDGDVAKLPEVIHPHNHRYDFMSNCLSGEVRNRTYLQTPYPNRDGALRMNRFAYQTPLNGGNGFTWEREEDLLMLDDRHYSRSSKFGCNYVMRAEEIHTIQITEPETILLLFQHKDVAPVGAVTQTWSPDQEPPALSGLYNRMTADHALVRLDQLNQCAHYFTVEVSS